MKFLSLACALAAVLLLALVSTIWFLRTSGLSPDQAPVLIEVAGQALRIDPAFVRRRDDLLHRQHDEFELVAALPDFQPAANRLAQVETSQIIVLSLRGKDPRLEPAEKPGRLYARFLREEEETVSDSLIARHFQAGSPYEGDVVIMTPPEGRLFWARCLLRKGDTAQICLSEIRSAEFDVTVRLSDSALAQWETITQRLHQLVAALRP
jgi:hypothetical protein